MKLTKQQLQQVIKEELENINESGFDPSKRLPLGYKMPPDEETKPKKAMRLLSRLRSHTTEEWSREARESFDALLETLIEMEEELQDFNP